MYLIAFTFLSVRDTFNGRGECVSCFTIILCNSHFRTSGRVISDIFDQHFSHVGTMEWNQDEIIMYNVIAVPNVPVLFRGPSVAKLNVSYNTLYNVSISPLCELGTATSVKLYYGK